MNNSLDEYVTVARETIKNHAIKAIQALEDQLVTAKSPVKIAKLNARISGWKHSLKMLENKNEKDQD